VNSGLRGIAHVLQRAGFVALDERRLASSANPRLVLV
jgi:hypothetical protein